MTIALFLSALFSSMLFFYCYTKYRVGPVYLFSTIFAILNCEFCHHVIDVNVYLVTLYCMFLVIRLVTLPYTNGRESIARIVLLFCERQLGTGIFGRLD